jgi:hypothetical protein
VLTACNRDQPTVELSDRDSLYRSGVGSHYLAMLFPRAQIPHPHSTRSAGDRDRLIAELPHCYCSYLSEVNFECVAVMATRPQVPHPDSVRRTGHSDWSAVQLPYRNRTHLLVVAAEEQMAGPRRPASPRDRPWHDVGQLIDTVSEGSGAALPGSELQFGGSPPRWLAMQ